MRFYNVIEDIDEKNGDIFPQSQMFNSSNNINAENYFNNVRSFNEDTIFPEFVIHKNASLTDIISASYVSGQLIMSEKLKDILVSYCNDRIQFAPITLLYKRKECRYWLMNNFESDFDLIDFNKSIIKKINGLNNRSIEINPTSKAGLEEFIKTKKPYEGVNISKLVLKDNIDRHIFSSTERLHLFILFQGCLKKR